MQFKEKIKAMMKNKKMMAYIFGALMLTIGLTVSYSIFTSRFGVTQNFVSNLSTGTMHLIFEDNDEGISEALEPGASIIKKFKIVNDGSLEASTGFNWLNMVNTYMDGSLSYNLKYSETEDGEYRELVPETNMPVSATPMSQALANEVSVPAHKTYYYNLEITFNILPEIIQDADLDALFATQFALGDVSRYIYYTLTVDPNGGTWNTFTEPQKYLLLNNGIMEIPDPTRAGYTFNGWEKTGESYEFVNKTFTMGVTDATFKALWDVNSYKVTIDVAGGTYPGPTEIDAEYGKTITLETPTKDGYEFGGWTVTGGTIDGNQLTITDPSAVTVTPIWRAKDVQYVVYHNKMTTSGTYTAVSSDTDKDEGTKPFNTTFTPPVRTDFIGFTAPEPEPLTITADPSQNTLTYNYSRNKYRLTVAKNEGTGGTDSQDVFYEATVNLDAPSKTGYSFTNWTKISGNGTLTDNSFTMGINGATIQANYSALPFAVTLNANSGIFDNDTNIVTKSTTVNYGAKYGEGSLGNLPTPTRAGYRFDGWFTSSSGGTQVTDDTVVNLSANQTLYAHWTAIKYTVTYNVNGGNALSTTSKQVTPGGTYGTLPTPTRTGYTFNGWYTEDNTKVTSSSTVTATSDHTLKAKWSAKSYTLTVKVNNSNYGQIWSGATTTVNYNGTGYASVMPNFGYRVSSINCTTGYTATTDREIASGTIGDITIKNNKQAGNGTCTANIESYEIHTKMSSSGTWDYHETEETGASCYYVNKYYGSMDNPNPTESTFTYRGRPNCRMTSTPVCKYGLGDTNNWHSGTEFDCKSYLSWHASAKIWTNQNPSISGQRGAGCEFEFMCPA